MVRDGRYEIDNYALTIGDKAEFNGHDYSDKAMGLSHLAIPPYLLLQLMGIQDPQWVRYFLILATIALPTILLSLVLFSFLSEMFGTSLYAIVSKN